MEIGTLCEVKGLSMEKKTFKIREYFFCILVFVLSLIGFLVSVALFREHPEPDSAAVFPTVTTGIMMLTSFIAVLQVRKNCPELTEEEKKADFGGNKVIAAIKEEMPLNSFVLAVSAIAYAVLLNVVGFYVSTALFMAGTITFLRRGKKIKQTLIVTAVSLVVIFLVVEKIFQIMLP